ncbi:MAG TPA: hypothetical protein VK203_15790 [Nostocaceae cyanobacterium]|nr:hypothetical protein [Nostocaceae cyanobacterium]
MISDLNSGVLLVAPETKLCICVMMEITVIVKAIADSWRNEAIAYFYLITYSFISQ